MRLTYTDIKKAHFRNIGKAGQFSDTAILEDFQYSLGVRYQLIFGSLSEYINQDTLTAETEANIQYYYYPVGTVSIDAVTLEIGDYKYPLNPIYDQKSWDLLNAIPFQPTTFPQFFFPRQRDFGLWPIPSDDDWTITFNRFYRDRNMLVDDYTDGTVSMTAGSTTVTGTNTTFTDAMVGRWFTVTNTATPGQGYWYRVASVSTATSLSLETVWAAATVSNVAYRIGESPELPEDGHVILPAGTAADFYAGVRNDSEKATQWNNTFWTGDMNNGVRDIDSKNVSSGLIGLIKKYKDRDKDILVDKDMSMQNPFNIWSQTINE